MTRMKLASGALALIVTSILIPQTVQAAERPVIVTAEADRPVAYVGYADLNLRNEAGIAVLKGRIHRAATDLCVDRETRDIERMVLGSACRAAAIESAEGQLTLAVARFGQAQYASLSRIAVSRP